MCGIAGWIDFERDLTQERPTTKAMTTTLARRGPDDEAYWISARCAFGHRRLVVVDPEGGGQPMVRRRGGRTYVVTYNGELYNTPELRAALEARGHVFESRSDTEALLLSYVEWGPACVERLNGIFAFGIWDEGEERLLLGRDRLGVKPLFYAARGRGLVFGSELKALLAHPAVQPRLGPEGLAEIFAVGPARTPGHGIFEGVHELRPGHCLAFDRAGLRIHRYWVLESRPHEDDLETTVATVRQLLEDTVARQLVADVPVSTLLSGGLDSSAVTAFAQAAFRRDGLGAIRTYSIDYVGNDGHFRPNAYQPNSDGPWVARVSEHLGTDHRSVLVDTPELIEALELVLRARDLPGMADVDASLLLFCREIKRESTVALSGEAADEVFGGYPWFGAAAEQARDGRGLTFPWAKLTHLRARLLSPELRDWIRPEAYVARRWEEALAEVPRLPGEDPVEARMRELFYLNITRFMPTLLDRKDRMSMAAGLEVRVPYCDHRLVEYVWNIPWFMKACDGREKGLLRRALRGVLPDDVIWRKKSPYPKSHNPSFLAATRSWVEEILADPASPILGLIDLDYVRELVRTDAADFNPSWFGQLMGGPQLFAYLAQIDVWLREYRVEVGRPLLSEAPPTTRPARPR